MSAVRQRRQPHAPARQRGDSCEKLMHAEDVAELLGMSKDWVYAEARHGRIPHVKLGRYTRFRAEAIHNWIKENERGTT